MMNFPRVFHFSKYFITDLFTCIILVIMAYQSNRQSHVNLYLFFSQKLKSLWQSHLWPMMMQWWCTAKTLLQFKILSKHESFRGKIMFIHFLMCNLVLKFFPAKIYYRQSGVSIFFFYLFITRVAAFQGMHVPPTKQSNTWLPRKCDYWTDRRSQSDPFVLICLTGDTKRCKYHHIAGRMIQSLCF